MSSASDELRLPHNAGAFGNVHIDAVVTWVDGGDPAHKEKRLRALASAKNKSLRHLDAGKTEHRFSDNGEILYCLHGIRRHLPWIRKIFLVTDQQCPQFLDETARANLSIEIIDHATIFEGYESNLPTFNSVSIETMLHRIPGLSDKHIYFNDDVIPIRASRVEDFFVDGKVVIRGRLSSTGVIPYESPRVLGTLLRAAGMLSRKERSAHLVPQMRAARLAGFRGTFFRSAHAPHAARVSTLRAFFDSHENALRQNIKHAFRNLEQFSPYPLAHHLEIAQGSHSILDGADCATLTFDSPASSRAAITLLQGEELKFLCIQNLGLAGPDIRQRVTDFLDARTRSSMSSPVSIARGACAFQ